MRDADEAPPAPEEPKHFAATPPDPPPSAAPPPVPEGPVFVPYVTIALTAVNVLVWVITLALGAHPMSPTPEWMFAHGGNAGAVTLDGEPWRIGSSMFLHYGFEHVAFNMVGLYGGGRLVEKLFGRVGFTAIYFASGIAGGVASALRPGVVSAGASGAIFGVMGALAAYYLLHRDRMDKAVASEAGGLLIFLGYNIVFGFVRPNVDMLAHVGGLGAGFLVALGLELCRRAGYPAIVAAVASLVLAGAAILFAPAPVDANQKAFKELEVVETKVIGRWNELVPKAQSGQISDDELATVIEREILPPWRTAVEAFDKSGAGDAQTRSRMLEYLRSRQAGWETMLEGLRAHDADVVSRGAKLFQDAEELLKKLNSK